MNETKTIVAALKAVLKRYEQTKDIHDFWEDIQEIVDDYDE
jgi:hypothetical protein